MDWTGVKEGLAQIGVPLLANAIVPGSGGFAASIAARILGVRNEPAEIATALAKATPEQVLSMKAEENRHQEELVRIAAEIDRQYLLDRQDARKRDIAIGGTNTRANWMIAGDVIGLIVCLVVIYLIRDAQGPGMGEMRGLLTAVAGYFGLGLRDAHQFEFGSSRGSKDKDAAITAVVTSVKEAGSQR